MCGPASKSSEWSSCISQPSTPSGGSETRKDDPFGGTVLSCAKCNMCYQSGSMTCGKCGSQMKFRYRAEHWCDVKNLARSSHGICGVTSAPSPTQSRQEAPNQSKHDVRTSCVPIVRVTGVTNCSGAYQKAKDNFNGKSHWMRSSGSGRVDGCSIMFTRLGWCIKDQTQTWYISTSTNGEDPPTSGWMQFKRHGHLPCCSIQVELLGS